MASSLTLFLLYPGGPAVLRWLTARTRAFFPRTFYGFRLHGEQILGARSNQQDSFSILAGDDALVLVLADGMGGYTGGELASRAAIEGFFQAFERENRSPGKRMKDAVTAANEQVRTVRKKRGKDDEMGTTLVAAWIGPEGLRWVSVGDSLLLLIREEKMFLLNDLHQYSAELERMADEGSISREEALSHPSRHSLTSALMGREVPLVDLREECFPLVPGTAFWSPATEWGLIWTPWARRGCGTCPCCPRRNWCGPCWKASTVTARPTRITPR